MTREDPAYRRPGWLDAHVRIRAGTVVIAGCCVAKKRSRNIVLFAFNKLFSVTLVVLCYQSSSD